MHFRLGIATHVTVMDKGQTVCRSTFEGLQSDDAIRHRCLAI